VLDVLPVADERQPNQRRNRPLARRLRDLHGAVAPLVVVPLLLTVSSGMGYRLLRDWGGLGREQTHWLMVVHEGEWLQHAFGRPGETVYVLLNGLGLLWMLISGTALLWQRLQGSRSKA